jgi:hypothetical protein
MPAVHIAITPVTAEADERTQAQRQDATDRLTNLGQINAAVGHVNTTQPAGWQVTINGVTVPVADFAVSPTDGEGRALVSLVVLADAVSVGRSPASVPAPTEKPKVGTWGQPGGPDPRESIAGWSPGLGEQVAVHAEQSVRSRMERLGFMDPPDSGTQPQVVPA